LLTAILGNRFDQVVSQVLQSSEVADLARPQLLRQGEFRARHQPMREVVVLTVISEALLRYRLQQRLQGIQIGGARHFCRPIGQVEDEISETHFLRQNVAQISQQGRRPLLQK
jgi:hypothetical protein